MDLKRRYRNGLNERMNVNVTVNDDNDDHLNDDDCFYKNENVCLCVVI